MTTHEKARNAFHEKADVTCEGSIRHLDEAVAAYLSALLPEDVAGLVERLNGVYRIPITDGLGPAGGEEPDNPNEFVRTFETPPIQKEAASLIQSQAARIAELEAGLAEALRLLGRYRTETPLGNQPHMIALEAETFAASARSLLTKDRQP